MTPIRKLIGALVALWLRDNPHAQGETWQVDECGVAVNVRIERAKPEYVVADKVASMTPEFSYS